MKKFFLIIAATLLSISAVQSLNLWAFLSYAPFNSPEGPYFETYLSIAANTVVFKQLENGKFQATVQVIMTFKQDQEIKAFTKYELKSPQVADTSNLDFHFIDQQRISLPNGNYEFEIQLSDQNKTVEATPFSQLISIDFPADQPAVSGIELVKSYTKNDNQGTLSKSGYDLVPYVFNFYPSQENGMIFYCELYDIDKKVGAGEKYILSYFVETFETNEKVKNLARIKKETAMPVSILLAELVLTNLPSGNYNLVVEARDQANEVIVSEKLFFQRSNPNARFSMEDLTSVNIQNSFVQEITNRDTLAEYISSTFPIASGLEKSFMKNSIKTANLETLQEFFLGFWQRRNSAAPQQAWLNYKEQVRIAEFNFGTPVKHGYQTDRGRVYLQYGPPNVRAERYNEPSNYPYEIWHYYKLGNNQSNKRFVFYSPDMVTSDFFLLHSDAIGEVNNPRWQVDLRSRLYQPIDISDTQVINSWGDMQEDYWILPN